MLVAATRRLQGAARIAETGGDHQQEYRNRSKHSEITTHELMWPIRLTWGPTAVKSSISASGREIGQLSSG